MSTDQSRPDRTESEVRRWATRVNGEPLTNRDIVNLVLAVDEDGNARHKETIDILDDQNARVVLLEEWRASCPVGSLSEYVATEHAERHAVHMVECHPPRREDDPKDADFCEQRSAGQSGVEGSLRVIQSEDRRVWVMWGVGLFLVTIIANSVVVWLIVRALEETVQ